MSVRIDGKRPDGKRTSVSIPNTVFCAYVASTMKEGQHRPAGYKARKLIREWISEGADSAHVQRNLVLACLSTRVLNNFELLADLGWLDGEE